METSIQLTRKDTSDQLYVGTFGGEYQDKGNLYSQYGIQIDNLAVDGLDPDEFKKLAILMVNHLILNGHSFKIVKSESQDQGEEIIAI